METLADVPVQKNVQVLNAEVAEEAVAALVMLGFQKSASQKVVISILKENPAMKVEQVIKSALKML